LNAVDRRLTRCRECHRQYDVSRRAVGSSFHCRCGTLLEVEEIVGHEASVVRCSSCGGPRQGKASACGYCGSDFTLHERDLHTICPSCLARISDRARYCHHCATLIAPQGTGGTETDRTCPACHEQASTLVSRGLGGDQLSVLECGRCAGLWLSSEVFAHLETRAQQEATASNVGPPGPARRPTGAAREGAARYRPCPVCKQLMHRRNYGRKSGVVVDTCHQHGLWFDSEELDAILEWVRQGGLERARKWAREMQSEEDRSRRSSAGERSADTAWLELRVTRAPSPLRDFVDGLLQFLSR
jgi:Zn-finger nucleic acid-binding protein